METYEYHQLLKHLYFEGYVDSYKEAEDLIEELTDEEFDFLYEEVFGIDEAFNQKGEFIRDPKSTYSGENNTSPPAVRSTPEAIRARESHREVLRRQREEEKTKRPEQIEAERQERMRKARLILNPQSSNESYETIISYLFDEGYAEDLDSAEQILENMSEGWKSDVLKATKKIAKKVGKTKVAKRAKKFVTRTALGAIGIPMIP